MSRVILLAGHGGAGTSAMAEATAEQAREDGSRVALVDASGVTAPQEQGKRDLVSDLMGGALGRLLLDAGTDPVLPEEWADLPAAALARQWQQIASARASADVVVIDGGSLARVRELVALPGVLLRLLDAAVTPRTAMWRDASGGTGLFDALSLARAEALAWQSVLVAESTSLRLVSRPTLDSVPSLLRTAGVLTMLGVRLDGVIVNRWPRRRDDAPRADRQQALDTREALEDGLPGVPVWRSTSRLRPVPKGHVVSDIVGSTRPDRRGSGHDDGGDGIERSNDDYILTVALLPVVRDGARVGVQGERLVLAFDGMHAFTPLPPVLRRCIPREARRVREGLAIRWTPDPDLWPAERVS